MAYSFDHYVGIWGYEAIFRQYKEQLGKLFIATARNDNDTRLFGRSLLPSIDMEDKEGWWNTFTITKKAQQKGTYIVKIVNVRPDKDGYPIFEVDVLGSVDESILVNSPLTSMFLASEYFNEQSRSALYNWNYVALRREIAKFVELPEFADVQVVAAEAVQKLMSGVVTIEQIHEWLVSPTDEEIREKQIEEDAKLFSSNWRLRNFQPYVDRADVPAWVNEINRSNWKRAAEFRKKTPVVDLSQYPNLCGEMQTAEDEHRSVSADDFIRWHENYRWGVMDGSIEAVAGSHLDQIEAHLAHAAALKAAKDAQKEASKAKKTAEKKAKKLAAKLGKEKAKAEADANS